MNVPNWLWWLVGLLVLLAVLYLVGVRVSVHMASIVGHPFIVW